MLLACLVALPSRAPWATEPVPTPLPRLSGILVSGRTRVAIFETVPGSTIAVEEGEQVGPYLVLGIAGQEVRVERDGRGLVLAIMDAGRRAGPIDTGGVTFGLVVNPQGPPDD